MSTIKSAVRTAKALADFVSAIKDAGITMEEMSELSVLRPDFGNVVKKIEMWVNPPTIKADNPTTGKVRMSHVYMTIEKRHEICKYVAENFNGRSVKTASKNTAEKFKDVSAKTINRIVKKETYAIISDLYYSINNGVIWVKT